MSEILESLSMGHNGGVIRVNYLGTANDKDEIRGRKKTIFVRSE